MIIDDTNTIFDIATYVRKKYNLLDYSVSVCNEVESEFNCKVKFKEPFSTCYIEIEGKYYSMLLLKIGIKDANV